jgi:hypothetical protein
MTVLMLCPSATGWRRRLYRVCGADRHARSQQSARMTMKLDSYK